MVTGDRYEPSGEDWSEPEQTWWGDPWKGYGNSISVEDLAMSVSEKEDDRTKKEGEKGWTWNLD